MENFSGFLIGENMWMGVMACAFITFILGFTGAAFLFWAIAIAAMLVGFAAPLWLLASFTTVALVFLIRPIRQLAVSAQLMKILKALKFIPSISATERTALEAGVVWIEADLFSGKPDFDKILKEPYPELTKEEQAFLDGPVDRLCDVMSDWEVWETREIPPAAWDIIKKEKFLGMIIPKEYGGLGFSAMAHSEVILKISTRSVAGAITVMVPNSLGPAELLIHYGTDEQKKNLLPKLATGEEIPCFALTEPSAGSDAGSITSDGVLFKGEDGKLYIKLNWNKRWITLAAIATTLGLAFRLKDPQNILGRGEDLGITCALIPAKTPGVVLGRRHDPLGVPFYNCPTQGKDVIVSINTIVGGLEGAGRGWKMLMECLAAGRGVSLPAQSTGGAKLVTKVASTHAAIRKQFGTAIGKFEGVEEPLARIAGFNYILESFRRFTLGALDKGIKPAVITAIAKFHATELSRRVINDGMDILGGAGISRGPRNILANLYIATPIGITVEGANIMTRTLIIFGQGALRAHPYAFKEVDAIEKGDTKAFDRAFWGHINHIVRNLFRSIGLSLTRGWLAGWPRGGSVSQYYRKLSWTSASFAIMADIAMGSLGGQLKMKEKITGRYADILSWMYIGTSVLRRFEADGKRKEDLPFVHFAMGHALYEIQRAFDGIFTNLEVPLLSWLIRGPIRIWSNFNPLGGEQIDKHTHKIATLILTDGEQRDRLTSGVYMSKDPEDALNRLERTFKTVKLAEGIEKKVRNAVKSNAIPKAKGAALVKSALDAKVITQEEFNTLTQAEKMRYEAIQVDDFSQEEYVGQSNSKAREPQGKAISGETLRRAH